MWQKNDSAKLYENLTVEDVLKSKHVNITI